jgi:hypothetical protein
MNRRMELKESSVKTLGLLHGWAWWWTVSTQDKWSPIPCPSTLFPGRRYRNLFWACGPHTVPAWSIPILVILLLRCLLLECSQILLGSVLPLKVN